MRSEWKTWISSWYSHTGRIENGPYTLIVDLFPLAFPPVQKLLKQTFLHPNGFHKVRVINPLT